MVRRRGLAMVQLDRALVSSYRLGSCYIYIYIYIYILAYMLFASPTFGFLLKMLDERLATVQAFLMPYFSYYMF